ncbi:hypothetical protein HDU76_007664 [Blyttiomyces sp. JEL0837]|nr:hypothetical protein HDU76_007664 [Blyttiomyces sp. JEL0837]
MTSTAPIETDEWLTKGQSEIDNKTKPPGSLGLLEQWSVRLIALQQTLKPVINKGTICLFAADHGLADEDVSQYPKVVTREMLRNLSTGGAAINALCNATQSALTLTITDVGVDTDETFPNILVAKQHSPHGTASSLKTSAMTTDQLQSAIETGKSTANTAIATGSQVIGIGELGIGNTAVASCLLLACLKSAEGNGEGEVVTGTGTGVEGERLAHKVKVVEEVVERHWSVVESGDWIEVMRVMGGLEIAAMAGAALAVAKSPSHTALLVDGFISSVAFLMALKMYPEYKTEFKKCGFLAHKSDEKGAVVVQRLIEKELGLKEGERKPVLDLGFRLGEGTGAALAFPILKAAAHVASDMNTFAGAGVSGSK